MKRFIPALIITLAVTGCTNVGSRTKSVQVGMTEQQLTEILGKPEVVTNRSDGTQVWVYAFGPGSDATTASYVLKDGKVVSLPPSS